VKRWELCAFNNLCQDKYLRLGREWDFCKTELMSEESMEELASVARESGVDPSIVFWSGSTKLEKSEKEKAGDRERFHVIDGAPEK